MGEGKTLYNSYEEEVDTSLSYEKMNSHVRGADTSQVMLKRSRHFPSLMEERKTLFRSHGEEHVLSRSCGRVAGTAHVRGEGNALSTYVGEG